MSEFATLEAPTEFTRVSTAYKQTTFSKTYIREGGGWGRSKLCNSGSDIITIDGFCLDSEREEPLVSESRNLYPVPTAKYGIPLCNKLNYAYQKKIHLCSNSLRSNEHKIFSA